MIRERHATTEFVCSEQSIIIMGSKKKGISRRTLDNSPTASSKSDQITWKYPEAEATVAINSPWMSSCYVSVLCDIF